MADFSIGKAIGSGFRLIARRPGAVVAWSAAYLLVSVAPMAMMFGYLFAEMPSLLAGMQHMDPAKGPTADMFRMQSHMMMANPLLFVTGLLGRVLLVGAVYRSMLEPGNGRFFSLRLGQQELWLALTLFVYSVIVGVAMIMMVMGAFAVGALVWLLCGLLMDPTAVLLARVALIGAVAVASLGGWLWVSVRLSMGSVMSFVERDFRLFESWNFTKRHTWKLMGLGITQGVLVVAIALVVECILVALIYVQTGGFDKAQLQALFPTDAFPHAKTLLWTLAPALVLGLACVGPFTAIIVAPLASVYRQLTDRGMDDGAADSPVLTQTAI